MTTDLLLQYGTHSEQGHSHPASINALARRFGGAGLPLLQLVDLEDFRLTT